MREPIELEPTRALGGFVFSAVQQLGPALKVFLDARNLEGEWELQIISGREFHARLVPVEAPVEVPANGAPKPPFVKHGPGKRKRA